mmetsp:Transcript_72591/g.146097  ORF Transcript_72591/g.146097 Transcript_72591/m.146097 type:complete len:433 (-) Transcript_72591:226-1524(-)
MVLCGKSGTVRKKVALCRKLLNVMAADAAADVPSDVSSTLTFLEVLSKAFPDAGRQGYWTAGHEALVSAEDVSDARASGSNLMYGEFLPHGFDKAMDSDHLWAARGGTLLELGSGTGKPALQALLQYPFKRVIGVELCAARHKIGVDALRRLCVDMPSAFNIEEEHEHEIVVGTTMAPALGNDSMTSTQVTRTLTLRRGDMLSTPAEEVRSATVLVMETCLPQPIFRGVCTLLTSTQTGARLLMYNDLGEMVLGADENGDAKNAVGNGRYGRLNVDRFQTSWAPENGHPFYVYERMPERKGAEETRFEEVVVVSARRQEHNIAQTACDLEERAAEIRCNHGWRIGEAVETLNIFFPSDAWFDNDAGGEWYAGWITRVQETLLPGGSDAHGDDDEEEGTVLSFTVIYEDGDVAEGLPVSQVRRRKIAPTPTPP